MGADGALLGRVEVPVARVTACTFGSPDLDELFITTSQYGLLEPKAGAVFREKVGVRGLPTQAFWGLTNGWGLAPGYQLLQQAFTAGL